MGENYKTKIILYEPFFKDICYVELLDQTKKFEGNDIIFDVSKDKFGQFQINLYTKLIMRNKNKKPLFYCTLNLVKGNNTYHFLSGKEVELHELLFFDVEELNIIVDGKKINSYDCFGKFKKVSLINLDNYEIGINGNKINLSNFRPYCEPKDNSFMYSFYDIEQKLIASKLIKTLELKDFNLIFEQNINILERYSNDISEIKSAESFNRVFSSLNNRYCNLYLKLKDEFNLVLPKTILEKTLNQDIFVDFFYYYAKLKIFVLLYFREDKDFKLFEKIFKNLQAIFSGLNEDNSLIAFEKISVLMSYSELFNIIDSPKIFADTKFQYIKVDKVEKNSIIYLSYEFINNYIENLTEDSPSYLQLVELNSELGYFNGNKVFSYDIVVLSDLKSHLKQIIPTVISFYELNNSNKNTFTECSIGAIGINKVTLINPYKNLDITKNILIDSKYDVKDAAMKLSEDIMHEAFGHKKLNLRFDFYEKDIKETQKKCFKNKKLKELVQINNINHEKYINILFDKDKSDSGNYFESSFGKFANTNIYTFTCLSRIKHGKLIDYPDLFYNRENLKKLQKYAYYRYLYFRAKENAEEVKKNKADNLNFKNIEELNELTLSEEIDYLSKFVSENLSDEIVTKTENNPNDNAKIFLNNTEKYIGKKRIIDFDFEKIDNYIEEKEKEPSPEKLSRKDLLNKILNTNLSYEQRRIYFKLISKQNYKI